VVICDDQPIIREIVATLVTARGDEVVAETGTAADAIEAVRTFAADLIVLDLGLPGMSGVDAIPHIHGAHPACDVIVLTALDSEIEKALAAGATAVFNKTQLLALDATLRRLSRAATSPV
jgi:DNA-binding NarL/FixJ family response regulator